VSETWRRKAYYDKRVLIDTGRVISSTVDDSLVCITGPQLEMLRNVTQYLKRRSTFVTEYHDNYYDAPTTAEWDELQAIVADLEETLMGCEALTTAIYAMASQLGCICLALKGAMAQGQPPDPGYTDQEYYDEYISDVEHGSGDPPAPFADWDEQLAYVCIGAQKLVDDAARAVLEMGTSLTVGTLITFSVINLFLLRLVKDGKVYPVHSGKVNVNLLVCMVDVSVKAQHTCPTYPAIYEFVARARRPRPRPSVPRRIGSTGNTVIFCVVAYP